MEETYLRRLIVLERIIQSLPEDNALRILLETIADSFWLQLGLALVVAVVMALGIHPLLVQTLPHMLQLFGAAIFLYYLAVALYFSRFRTMESLTATLALVLTSIALFALDVYGKEPNFAFRPTPVFVVYILTASAITTTIFNRYLDDLLSRRIRIMELEREVRQRDEISGKIVRTEKAEEDLSIARQAEKQRREVVKHYSSLFVSMQALGRELKGDQIVVGIWRTLKYGIGARALQVYELRGDRLVLVKAFQARPEEEAGSMAARAHAAGDASVVAPPSEALEPSAFGHTEIPVGPDAGGLFPLVVRSRKAFFRDDIDRDMAMRKTAAQGPVGVFCVYPLIDLKTDRFMGLINVSECARPVLEAEERQVMRTTADLAALALAHWETFREKERQTLELRKKFETYVSPGVVQQIVDNPEFVHTRRQKVTVVFVDLRGFTSLSEALTPEVVVALLGDFFDHLTPVIFQYGGTLDKYIGDEIMALFGAPVAHPDDTRRAVLCCWEMRQAFAQVRERWTTRLGRPVEIGIAVNTGEAIVGSIGSESLKNYTAIGDAVNTAARLEGVTGPGKICMTRTTFEEVQDVVEAEWMPPVRVQGKAQPLEWLEVKGLKGTAGAPAAAAPQPQAAPLVSSHELARQVLSTQPGKVRAGPGAGAPIAPAAAAARPVTNPGLARAPSSAGGPRPAAPASNPGAGAPAARATGGPPPEEGRGAGPGGKPTGGQGS